MTEKKVKNILKTLIKLSFFLACAIYVFVIISNDLDTGLTGIGIYPYQVLALLVAQIAHLFLFSYRMRFIIQTQSTSRIQFSIWMRIFLVSRVLNSVMPQSGNVYRSVELKRRHGVEYSDYVSSFISLSWMNAAISLFMGGIALVFVAPKLEVINTPLYISFLVMSLVVTILPLFVTRFFRAFKNKVVIKLNSVLEHGISIFKSRVVFIKLMLMNMSVLLLSVLILHLSFTTVGTFLGVGPLLVFVVIQQQSNVIAITPNNIGVQEALFGILGELMGETGSVIVIASLLVRVGGHGAVFLCAVPFGVLSAMRQHLQRPNNKVTT